MKVIFLDIDGVLVTESHLLSLDAQGKSMKDGFHHHIFDPKCVENLKRILDATGAKIILSSVWRMFGREIFDAIWKGRNMPGEVIDFTPHTIRGQSILTRGTEIAAWLSDHVGEVESFVIIDDDTFDLNDHQMPRVVQTTWRNGLTDILANDAIGILNTK